MQCSIVCLCVIVDRVILRVVTFSVKSGKMLGSSHTAGESQAESWESYAVIFCRGKICTFTKIIREIIIPA